MPTYDYVCRACDHEFELFQSMSAGVKRKCPQCGKLKLERLIGAGAGIIFKGSGFYETDYRSDTYKKDAKAEKKAADGATSSDKDSKKKDSVKSDSTTTSSKSDSSSKQSSGEN